VAFIAQAVAEAIPANDIRKINISGHGTSCTQGWRNRTSHHCLQ
jgi:hypothetical protein